MAGVRLENVSKTFNKKIKAVDNFSLEARDNEIMVIVGPSGCGKTTTLRIIAGLEKSDAGHIYIGDRLVNEIPPRDRDVAMVFQNFALYPHMNVFENMAFPLKMRKVSKEEMGRRVAQAAKLLGVEELLRRRPHTLSGGQRQRVAIGRAIVRNPEVFLYDEPLSNLDAQMRLSMRTELKAIHNRLHTTTIYVTHDQTEAMAVGERICVMKDGRIRQVGRPREIYEMPADRFVAGFFGAPSMNFFVGRLLFENELPLLSIGNTIIALPPRLKNLTIGNLGRGLVLGLRPEHFLFDPPPRLLVEDKSGGNCIDAKVELIEYQGQRENICMMNDSVGRFIVSCQLRRNFQIGDKVKIYVDTNRILLFEDGPNGKIVNA